MVALTIALALTPAGAVVGGEPDGNRHPYVGAADNRHCGVGFGSGVLVSPTVYVMSGHGAHFCLDKGIRQGRVTFEEDARNSTAFHVGTIHAHPEYGGPGKANDVGVIVFDTPISGITPARLGAESFLDELGPQGLHGEIFTTVGYGASRLLGGANGGGPPHVDGSSRGTRRLAHEQFLSLAEDKIHLQMHEDGQTCTGDSGSPSLFEGSNLVAGISVAGDAACANMDEHQRLDTPSVRGFLGQFIALP